MLGKRTHDEMNCDLDSLIKKDRYDSSQQQQPPNQFRKRDEHTFHHSNKYQRTHPNTV